MKIFVTGHDGFIGSHLTPQLASKYQVEVLRADLLDFDAVAAEIAQFAPDIIVHLAARTEVEKSFYEQTTFSQINYTGSVNLIEAAARVPNFKKFVFASTMEVYGWQPISDLVEKQGFVNPSDHEVFDENTVPNPNAPYAVAKLAVEKYLEYMHRAQKFPYVTIRQTNSYGRSDNDFFVTEQIITQMLTNTRVINLGYRAPYRNFLHINDLIAAWLAVIETPGLIGDIFTLGPDAPIQISDYAALIAKKLNWTGTINWDTKPARPGEIYWLNSGHAAITKKTGWYPTVDLSTGVDQTINIWRNK